jgi:biopolymer transport protein ExbD
MSDQKQFFDVWFVQTNTVYKEVPFTVVTDWVQQARLNVDDMIKPAGAPNWFKVGGLPMFQAFVPQPAPAAEVGDVAEALEPVEMDVGWKKTHSDEDDDVDMIPLIDISLVLLIFFMMTTTVAAISRINVPDMINATTIETNPGVLRIDIDKGPNGTPIYSVARGTEPPREEDDQLGDIQSLSIRIDEVLKQAQVPPEVRIAAHQELSYEVVETIMQKLDQLRDRNLISNYFIEVNERPKR